MYLVKGDVVLIFDQDQIDREVDGVRTDDARINSAPRRIPFNQSVDILSV